MSKLLSTLFLTLLTMVLSIAVMYHGWGLEVKSWGWVAGGYLGIVIIGGLSGSISEK